MSHANHKSHARPIQPALILAAILLAAAGPLQAQTSLYVDDDSPPGGDGLSWNTAFDNLQDALAAAAGSGGSVTDIVVGDGLYRPSAVGDIAATYTMQAGLRITGSFDGFGSASPNDRDLIAFESVLSGDLNGDDTPGAGNRADNTTTLVTVPGTADATAILDGFTLRSGGNAASQGGGIRAQSPSAATFIQCTVVDCVGSVGGGVNMISASPTFDSCRFLGNSAVALDGGAVRHQGGSPDFINCLFSGNSSVRFGGAYVSFFGETSFLNCTFVWNTAGNGGGGVRLQQGGTTIRNTILWNNSDASGITQSAQIDTLSASANPALSYSDVQGLTGSLGGVGNFDADPLFADADGTDNVIGTQDDDLSLPEGSPCINAGDPDEIGLPAVDLDGNDRVQECRVDIGALESPIIAADCNGNQVADACDLAGGTGTDCNANGVPDSCEGTADCNTNGVLDICDIAEQPNLDCDQNHVLDGCEGLFACDPPSGALCPDCDVHCDGIVNGLDIAVMVTSGTFGLPTCEAMVPRADVNHDGMVNGLDVSIATSSACWGL